MDSIWNFTFHMEFQLDSKIFCMKGIVQPEFKNENTRQTNRVHFNNPVFTSQFTDVWCKPSANQFHLGRIPQSRFQPDLQDQVPFQFRTNSQPQIGQQAQYQYGVGSQPSIPIRLEQPPVAPHTQIFSQPYQYPITSMKLQPITITPFDGSYNQWETFRDSFEAMVNQTGMTAIEKFHRLKQLLIGSASSFIENVQLSDNNYRQVWQDLKNYYDNPRRITMSYMNGLF